MTAPKTTSSGEQGTSNVLLAGGTGTVGREVVKGLVARGFAPRVLSRDPEKAQSILGPSVEIVRGDLTHPESLAVALRGVAFLVSPAAAYINGACIPIDGGMAVA